MRDAPPPDSDLPALTRSVAACLASVLDLDTGEVPAPPADEPDPWTVWGHWLAERGLGLVPVRDPAGFAWAGPWLALLRSGARDGGHVCAVAFGVPPGIVWSPLGGPETLADVELGYVVAPLDAAGWTPAVTSGRGSGRVELLALAPDAEAPMRVVPEVTARAGRGLEGDRYFAARGTFSGGSADGRALTLVEVEALEDLGLPVAPAQARRNVVTRGIDLNALVGRRFRVGEVECAGRRLCEPCAHLQRLTVPGILRGLVHRGGLRADVLSDGTIRVGDAVVAEP